jgi:hypothetical protein
MLAISSAVFVIIAGVGLPSGVAGIESIHLHFPKWIYSASAAGVNFVSSVFAPAIVSPGIVAVSVYAIVNKKDDFFDLK